MNKKENSRLSSILIRWYNANKRELPWRNTTDPYKIWLSEIILQQTRVDQGYPYYNRFIQKYPTIDVLAKADENDVLKLWQGLGYYSRARNLHATAKIITDNYGGSFPIEYKEILKLKGIGKYTAAAITSFAYNSPHAVVDGNVYRVLSRIFAIEEPIDSSNGEKIFSELAQELLDETNAGLHNQAIMEFGALQCTPTSPDCTNCPASPICLAYSQNNVSSYPKKKGKQKVRNRHFNYFDIRNGEYMYLHKRETKGIWQNLYELPLVETTSSLSIDEIQKGEVLKELLNTSSSISIQHTYQAKHILSHQIIYASFYRVETTNAQLSKNYIKIKTSDIEDYPVSRLVHKYLEQL